MKEIKFRAFCQVCNKFIFVYDNLMQYKDRFVCQCPHHNAWTETKLMQYTGLKDKNGKEIYEGDIVNIYDWGVSYNYMIGKGTIVWDKVELCFTTYPEFIEDRYDFCRKATFKIIGNVHQNSESLND